MNEEARNETLASIEQVFTTIRSTPTTADHSIYFSHLDELCAVYKENTDDLKKYWKRLARVQGKNPALVQLAWKNYIIQLNILEAKLDNHVNTLYATCAALEKAKEESQCQKDAETSTSCQEFPEAANQPTPAPDEQ